MDQAPHHTSETQTKIPRVVWALWLQGFDHAPPLVDLCVRSWQGQNPGWTVNLLSENNIREFLDPAFCDELLATDLSFTMKADIIRLALVARHGGVWVDADCLCVQPLDDWIDDAARSGFFAFSFIEEDHWFSDQTVPFWHRLVDKTKDRVMANWFLAGTPGNHIATTFVDLHYKLLKTAAARRRSATKTIAKAIFKRMRRNAYLGSLASSERLIGILGGYPYFIFHYHFAKQLRTAPAFCDAWKAVPKYDARTALQFSRSLGLPVDDHFKASMRGTETPVFKFHARHAAPKQQGAVTQFDWLKSTFDQ